MGDCSEGVGGAAAGGDADESVGWGEAGSDEVCGALLGGVFGGFAGGAEGGVSPGDDALEEGGWDGEGGRALGGVEDAEAAAGSGSDVEEAATLGEAGGDGVDCGDDVGQLSGYCGGDLGVLIVDELEHLCGREAVDVFGCRIARFGGEIGEGLGGGRTGDLHVCFIIAQVGAGRNGRDEERGGEVNSEQEIFSIPT